ncbi:hypothetical protein [Fibrella rubiginis]|uniref:hypothetical protein n=1 Tax=Fibrella rubiginis TaxID=2817060 RepID=UPI00286D7DDE|nr:hypothetical protein [Fibrella rubiginis]
MQEQGIVGSTWNYKLAPIYTVGILDFLFDDEKNDNRSSTQCNSKTRIAGYFMKS